MILQHYLDRLENTLRSRQELDVMHMRSRIFGELGFFHAEVHFYDRSRLFVTEESVQVVGRQIIRQEYTFHYQAADSTLIFRYDNSPHYPDLATFPHHKHLPRGVVESEPPDLTDVLNEIDALLYPSDPSDESPDA